MRKNFSQTQNASIKAFCVAKESFKFSFPSKSFVSVGVRAIVAELYRGLSGSLRQKSEREREVIFQHEMIVLLKSQNRDGSQLCSWYSLFSSWSGVTRCRGAARTAAARIPDAESNVDGIVYHCMRIRSLRFRDCVVDMRGAWMLEGAVESQGDRLRTAPELPVSGIMASTPATKRSALSQSWDHDSTIMQAQGPQNGRQQH
eukprot:2741462-Amphidinium_carterae.3